MPAIDFIPMGIDAQWPSRRWLDFLEGPAAGPFWGIVLGYSSESVALYVGTHPRSRFDNEMARPGDDPVREIAFSAAHQMINRVLAGVDITGGKRSRLVTLLTQYSVKRAEEHQAWKTIRWSLPLASLATGEVRAKVTSLAGWNASFSLVGDRYITAVSYGIPLDDLAFTQVSDPVLYGFTLEDAELPVTIPADVPGTSAGERLHPELEAMLDSGPTANTPE